MLVSRPQSITLPQLAELAAWGHNRIAKIYLHWTVGTYDQVYDDYHLCIGGDGTVYRTCQQLTDRKSHTWHRNTGSIGIALCCALGAVAGSGSDADLGPYAPTAAQTDSLARAAALLVHKLALTPDRHTVLTHCEAAFIDGYGPGSGNPQTRWDLWYMRDSPGDGTMKPGGQVLRGKIRWYLARQQAPSGQANN